MKNTIFRITFLILLFIESATGQSLSAINPTPKSTCNPSCFNINFQNQTLNGWDAYYATNASSTSAFILNGNTGGPAGSVIQAGGPDTNTFNSYQVQLKTTPGSDPIAGGLIPYAPPLGGLSAMIGDGPNAHYGVGILEQTYMVDPSEPILTIQYAVVLENAAHSFSQSPLFKMEVLDQSGNPVPGCGQYFVVAGPGMPGFIPVPYAQNNDTVYCRPWSTIFVPLYNYIGQCVTVRFTTADCALGGHFGYAYVSATCSKLNLTVSSNVFCLGQQSATITGPPGAAAYQWSTTGGCITGSTTKQSLTVSCAGTYSVIVQSSAGAQCVDTLSIVIPAIPMGPPPTPCFTATHVCSGTSTLFNASCSSPLVGTKFYWDFYNNGHINDSSGATPSFIYNVGGTYNVHLHLVTISGCGADTVIAVVVDPSNTPPFVISTTITNASAGGACNGKITLNITCGSVIDTLKTSFDNTSATFANGVPPVIVTGNKSCGVLAGPSYKTLALTFCNLCPGVHKFYIIPSAATPPSNCNPGGLFGDTLTVIINSSGAITPMLTLSHDTIYSTYASTYKWYFNSNIIAGATNSFYVFSQEGAYTVFTVGVNGDGALSDPLLITSISAPQKEAVLNIYPNPAGNELWIESSEMMTNKNKVTIELYNILGEKVLRAQPITQNSQLKTMIDVSSLEKGIYILHVDAGTKTFHTKVVKN